MEENLCLGGFHVQVLALCALGEIAGEEVEECLHLRVECLSNTSSRHERRGRQKANLLGLRIGDSGNKMANLIAHRLGRNAGGCGAEIDVASASDPRIERVVSR